MNWKLHGVYAVMSLLLLVPITSMAASPPTSNASGMSHMSGGSLALWA